jgi:hypothetical protein
MPHANAKEAFVWQAAAGPERARLLGAIAIALSSGCLGILLGRWSVELTPAQPPNRTAALIEAVSKETQAKALSRARPEGGEGEARPAPAADPPAPEAAALGSAPLEGEASARAGGQQPASAASTVPDEPVEAKPQPPGAPLPAMKQAGELASEAVAPRRQPAIATERRLGPASVRPPARDYQALRDDLLSR